MATREEVREQQDAGEIEKSRGESREMAPTTGKQTASRSKSKGEEKTMEKYVTGEDMWRKGLEKIIREIEEMRREMREEMERMKEQITEERREREEERKKEREEWKNEKQSLDRRIATMEWINEKKEREERRNNIIIKGMKWERENLKQEVTEFLEDNLKVKVKIGKIRKIRQYEGRNLVMAELESWEQKREIMNKKKELKKGIIIEDDLTRREREIQRKLREKAREEREKGDSKAKIGYKKIYLNGKWYRWNEKEEKLEEERKWRKE